MIKNILFCTLFFLIGSVVNSQTQIGIDLDGVSSYGFFGNDVSISSDGLTVAVGAPKHSSHPALQNGLVRVYKFISGEWTQIGQDLLGLHGNEFGGSISLSSEGNVLAVGSIYADDDPDIQRGQVKVFEYVDGIWLQVGQNLNGESINGNFGFEVDLSADGNRLAVGANQDSTVGGEESGSVRIFDLIGGIWQQVGEDINGSYSFILFGESVKLSDDGNIVAIGAPNHFSKGQVRVLQNTDGNWTQIGQNINGNSGDFFGKSVSLSSDGSVLAIGAPQSFGSGNSGGKAVIYNLIDGQWFQIGQNLFGLNGDTFGMSISLSFDGSIVAVGAPFKNTENGENSGQVKVFKNIENTWIQVGESIVGEIEYENCGTGVSMSDNGESILIGSSGFTSSNNLYYGRARVFGMTSELAIIEVIEDINGNINGINVTASQLNSINGVSGAIDGVNYTTALGNGEFVDVYNPTSIEIQLIIDQVNSSLSINENHLFNLFLYPNPVKDELNINLNKGLELKQVNIYNIQSQYLYSFKTSKIDIRNLASGIYFIEVETNKGKSTKKIIVE